MSEWTSIDGETPIDPSDIKDRTIRTRADLIEAEFANIRKPHLKYLAGKLNSRVAPFDVKWFLRLHHEMFRDVLKQAGKPRQRSLNLGVEHNQILTQLSALAEDLIAWRESGTSLLEQAALLHHRAVWIHPFVNGNGRWARMLANIWLRLHKARPVEWPEQTIGAESLIRSEYIDAIRVADEGDFEPLIALHERYAV